MQFTAEMEAEAQMYAKSYGVSIEIARRDVRHEYEQTDTDIDAFYERIETYVEG